MRSLSCVLQFAYFWQGGKAPVQLGRAVTPQLQNQAPPPHPHQPKSPPAVLRRRACERSAAWVLSAAAGAGYLGRGAARAGLPCRSAEAYWVVVPVVVELLVLELVELEELLLEELSATRTVSEMAVPAFCVPLGEMPVTTAVA